MSRRIWPSLVLLAAIAGCDSPASPEPSAPADAVPEAVSQEPLAAAEAEHVELQKAYSAARSAYFKQRSALRKAGDKEGLAALARPEATFVPQFEEAAERYAASDGEVLFLATVVSITSRSDGAAAKATMDKLLEEHLGSPELKRAMVPGFLLMVGAALGAAFLA